MRVLCLNAGSSSLKVALVVTGGSRGGGEGEVRAAQTEIAVAGDGALAADALRRALDEAGIGAPDAIGHRLVHGGPDRTEPVVLSPSVRALLDVAIPFAPLHLPAELAVVDAAGRAFPGVPQVGCFDTAFHATLPDVARRLPIAAWADRRGVRRYGFHGLSCEYVVARIGKETLGPAVVAHLGSGASMTAIREGASVDTTMGMSPSGGIMMGTRPGDLDPGALVHLLDAEGWGPRELERFVNHECGLRGVSEAGSDMRALLAARGADPRARLAVALFVYTAQKAIGALAVALGGLRTLVFTGGIGARSPVIRAEIAERLGFLGIAIDPARNAVNADVVSPSSPAASCTVRVLETDEEVVIARHVHACIGRASAPS